MKTNVLLSIIMAGMFAVTSFAQNQQIPNGGFESWHTEGQGEDPDSWGSLFNQFNSPYVLVSKTADAYNGSYALKIDCDTGTVPPPLGSGIPGDTIYGSLFLGLSNAQVDNAKVPFASKPDSLAGYVKGTVLAGGMFLRTYLFSAGQIIAEATYFIVSSMNTYTRFAVPFNYIQSVTPDTMGFMIIAAHPGISPKAHPANEFYIDDLALLYNQSPIADAESGFETVVTWNIVSDRVIIENRSGEVLHVELYDVTGKKRMHGDLNPGNNNFSLQRFPEGIYFYRVTDRSGKTVKSGKWSNR